MTFIGWTLLGLGALLMYDAYKGVGTMATIQAVLSGKPLPKKA